MSKLKKCFLLMIIMLLLFMIPISFAAENNTEDANTIGISESDDYY